MYYCAHHERDAKFVRHDVVQNRVDRRGHIIEHAGYVGEEKIEELGQLAVGAYVVLGVCPVNGDQSLHVKRRPANEKGNHYGNCNRITLIV